MATTSNDILFMPTDNLRAIFAHTKDATKWTNPYGLMPEMETEMHIDLVKDAGIYLMSGNAETLPGEDTANMVVYAKGFDPKLDDDWHEEATYAAGGDDFCEPLPITEEVAKAIADGHTFFVQFNPDNKGMSYGTIIP